MGFYVYIYRDRFGAVVYVGKGTGRRAWLHKSGSNNSTLTKLIAEQNLKPEIVFCTADEVEALAHEALLIAHFGRQNEGGTLLNHRVSFPVVVPVAVKERMQQLRSDPDFVARCLSGLEKDKLRNARLFKVSEARKAKREMRHWLSINKDPLIVQRRKLWLRKRHSNNRQIRRAMILKRGWTLSSDGS